MRSDPFTTLTTSVLISTFVGVVYTYTTYEFGEDCKYLTKYLDEDDKIYVEYNGENVVGSCNTFQFKGESDDDYLDEYKVCLTPVYFNDPDCAVSVNIKSSYFSVTKHTITCTRNKDEKYCGSQGDTLYIEFKSGSSRKSNANFRFSVTATKVYDYSDHNAALIGGIVGGVIFGLILITSCTAIFCWCVCRRKPSQGRVLSPNQGPANAYVQYSSQPQQNIACATLTTGTSPALQPTAPQQTLGVTSTQPPNYQWSAPPPSYNNVMETSTAK